MLETPLTGRFLGENRRLVFSAPAPYYALIRTVAAVGGVMVLLSFTPFDLPFYPGWWLMVGGLLVCAAVLAAFSLQIITFDLKERIYRRRQGPGLIPRFTRGRIDDLDAIVVVAETKPGIQPMVVFHMVLHWKGSREPIMVLQRESHLLPSGPINQNAGLFLQNAHRYSQALGIKFFDNSYFPGPNPMPIWR